MRLMVRLLLPLVPWAMLSVTVWRWLLGREPRFALGQRLGFVPPPTAGQTVWLHAASNGELSSARWGIEDLLAARAGLQVLVTTNTATAQAMGADMVYMGTRFIATQEANAVEPYKRMIVESGSRDVTYTNVFSGVHGNYLSKSMVAAGLDPANLPVVETGKTYVAGHKREKPKAWKDIWGAGQGAGAIDDIPPVAALVDRLEREYRAAASRVAGLVS